jgi:ParB family transcriptional regulator, chromosome partitioning protein
MAEDPVQIQLAAAAAGGGKQQGPRGLGRGLSALLGEGEPQPPPTVAAAAAAAADVPDSSARSRVLPLAFLKPNRLQPRRFFDAGELKELADSIKEKGILQPILVRPTDGPDSYEIVAGERRWRAAQLAKLHEVPVVIRPLTDNESLEIAIIENVQRAGLNAIEEAMGYQELINRFSYTQEQLSDVIGKSRPHIANMLRLLKLPDSIKEMITDGRLSAGHARTLVGAPNAEQLATEIVSGGLNVREAEKKVATGPKRTVAKKPTKDADTKALEASVSNSLGMTVQIEHKGEKGGVVQIHYKNLEQLDEIMRRLNTFVEVD